MSMIRNFAKKIGYELIKSKKQPTLSNHLACVLSHYKIDTIIDVGANIGQFGQDLRNLGFRGKILSFEPVLETYQQLVENSLKDENWHTFNAALGEENNEAVINISDSSDLNSILNANEFGVKTFSHLAQKKQQLIKVYKLDNFISSNNLTLGSNIMLKTDTQGYDLKVFRGAKSILANIKCIVTELSLTPIYAEMPHYLEALSEYETNNFQVSGIYPISRNKSDLSLIEIDCVLVRSDMPITK